MILVQTRSSSGVRNLIFVCVSALLQYKNLVRKRRFQRNMLELHSCHSLEPLGVGPIGEKVQILVADTFQKMSEIDDFEDYLVDGLHFNAKGNALLYSLLHPLLS